MFENLEILVVVPILALLALSLLRLEDRPPRLRVALGVVTLFFCGFLGLRALAPDAWFWRNSEVDRKTRWLQKHLKKTPGWETRPVVIMLGSSITYYGIDEDFLEQELLRLGTPATVLSFCMPGDNHHERLYMLEVFLRKIGSKNRKKLAETQVLLVEEVFNEYDRNPLFRMEKESGTERAILFLHPRNALKAWQAYARALKAGDGDLSGFRAASLLTEHALLNRFAVGTFSSMRLPESRERITPSFFALEGKKENFSFEDIVASRKAVSKNSSLQEQLPYPQWEVWQRHLHKLMSPYVDAYGFYSVPTLEIHREYYQNNFFNNIPNEVLKIPHPDESEMMSLMNPDFWFDGVHFTGEGARNVTTWMAVPLSALLKKTNSANPLTELTK